MENIFLILMLASLAGLFVGLVKPEKVIFIKSLDKTRKNALLIYGIGTIFFFILFGVSLDNKHITNPIHFRIIKTDSSASQITFRIALDKRYEKDTLIEIARILKSERNWTEKLVCFFDIGVYSESFAWATCAYLPQCETCSTDKDSENNDIEFKQIGIDRFKAEKLLKLTFDSIENKQLLGEFIYDTHESKTQFYKTNDDNVIEVNLYSDGGKSIDYLKEKTIGNEKRLYYTNKNSWFDESRDSKLYWIISKDNNTIVRFDSEGKPTLRLILE